MKHNVFFFIKLKPFLKRMTSPDQLTLQRSVLRSVVAHLQVLDWGIITGSLWGGVKITRNHLGKVWSHHTYFWHKQQ